jgi:hypothetical protein
VNLGCRLAEAFDAGKDVVSGFGPSERLGRLVVGLNKAVDRLPEFPDRSVDIATNLLLGQQGEEAHDLIDPRSRGRCKVQIVARLAAKSVVDELGLYAWRRCRER